MSLKDIYENQIQTFLSSKWFLNQLPGKDEFQNISNAAIFHFLAFSLQTVKEQNQNRTWKSVLNFCCQNYSRVKPDLPEGYKFLMFLEEAT